MMNTSENEIVIGYDLEKYQGWGKLDPIRIDISPKTNSHILLCGMSGSGKSYTETLLLGKLAVACGCGKVFFADFKQDDHFSFLRECPRYYPYDKSLEALDAVYEVMHKRQSGEDTSRYPVTLIWDEYMANILALQGQDKKTAEAAMRKSSEILMLGRSLAVRNFYSMQRCDASGFPSGSRLNYGVVIILGPAIRSIYEMLLPREYIERIGDRVFGRGEGVVLLQGSEMRFIKIPTVRDEKKLQRVCIDALTKN